MLMLEPAWRLSLNMSYSRSGHLRFILGGNKNKHDLCTSLGNPQNDVVLCHISDVVIFDFTQ